MLDKLYIVHGNKLSKVNPDFNKQDRDFIRLRDYNVESIFDFYCLANGKASEMIKLIDQLPTDKRRLFPKKVCLYNIVKREGFARRYKILLDSVMKSKEKEIALTFETLNNMARAISVRYMERLLQKENANPLDVSHKDLNTIWQITRTERGLPTNITHTTNTEIGEGTKRVFEKKGAKDLYEAFMSLPNINKNQIINKLTEDGSGTPKMLNRGSDK